MEVSFLGTLGFSIAHPPRLAQVSSVGQPLVGSIAGVVRAPAVVRARHAAEHEEARARRRFDPYEGAALEWPPLLWRV